MKKCIICGKYFKIKKNPKQICCSRSCNATYRCKEKSKSFKTPKCKVCGKETARNSNRIYCSNKCRGIDWRGENASNWKGGINTKNDGYETVIVRNHPFADRNNRILRHRFLVENWLVENEPDSKFLIEIEGKKYLRNGVVIHHKNDIKNDNRIENLEILESQAIHLSKHNFLLDSRSISPK